MTNRIRVPVLTIALFVSAFLLFVCQPMVGKMVLPYLGGAAGVWTTCVLFFQAMLLAGYLYAHFLGCVSDVRKQILTHGVVLVLALAFLPIRFNPGSPQTMPRNPSLDLLLQLFISVGIPFFVASATAPLLQNWFSRTRDKTAGDPYFLYSASNAGSLLALAAYPLVLEPRFGVPEQSRLWFIGYVALILLIGIVAALVWHVPGQDQRKVRVIDANPRDPGRFKILYWIAAAFVPSALMLAVTNQIASDLASVPFLWILPLAIYLLTFIFAFARKFHPSPSTLSRRIPILLLLFFPIVAVSLPAPPGYNWLLIGAHLALLGGGALLCHTALAASRPDPRYLTEFYFGIALGGVLGGVFTAILAPLVFKTIIEYPLLIALVPFFRSGKSGKRDWLVPIGFAAAVFATWFVLQTTGLDSNVEAVALAHTTFFFICYKFRDRVWRFALSFGILVMAYTMLLPDYVTGASALYTSRNFFGMKRVVEDKEAHLRKLLHGDTVHGVESTLPQRSGQPLSYYYRTGPVGDVIGAMRRREKPEHFGVIGLGSGTMAAYADPTHHVTFFEIDPSMESIARRYFTFLPRCGSNCDVVIGDGRLRVAGAPNGSFDLLMFDAFSSDSIPSHLLSREAVQLYLSKTAPDGMLLFHVSNRYLDIARLVSALVSDAGLVAYSRIDEAGELEAQGKTRSNYVVAARNLDDLDGIVHSRGWKRVVRPENFRSWTDDYSNLLSLIRWH